MLCYQLCHYEVLEGGGVGEDGWVEGGGRKGVDWIGERSRNGS